MYAPVLLFLACGLSVSSATLLTCSQGPACSYSVSCECSEAAGSLQWTISSPGPDASVLCESERYIPTSNGVGVHTTCGPAGSGNTVVLDAIDENPGQPSLLRSTLNFTANEDVVVTCASTRDRTNTTIQAARVPSPPEDLHIFVTSTADGSVTTVRVEWDPPVDDGGAPITSYQVTVNEAVPLNTSQQEASFTITSLYMYLVKVQAMNCAGYGNISRILIGTRAESVTTHGSSGTISSELSTTNTDVFTTSTSTEDNDSDNTKFLLRLDLAGVVGVVVGVLVVMVLGYTCGLLTGLLVVRHSKCLHTSASPAQPDTPAVPTYEEVLQPTPASIPLQENLSYAHIQYKQAAP